MRITRRVGTTVDTPLLFNGMYGVMTELTSKAITMSYVIAILTLILGFLGVWHPSSLDGSLLVASERTNRIKRLCRRLGIVMIVLGLLLLGLNLFVM